MSVCVRLFGNHDFSGAFDLNTGKGVSQGQSRLRHETFFFQNTVLQDLRFSAFGRPSQRVTVF